MVIGEKLSKVDKEILAWQIGRKPRNLWGIMKRCKQGAPKVVVNYPISKAKADANFFPTVFWLTCPKIVSSISKLEDRGYIGHVQRRIENNATIFQELYEAHVEYIFIRRALLGKDKILAIKTERQAFYKKIEQVGIGGLSDLKKVKCLHMHYAHYLATKINPIGQLVDSVLSMSEQQDKCYVCHYAGVAEQADAADLKSAEPKGSCRFEPGPRHQKKSKLAKLSKSSG